MAPGTSQDPTHALPPRLLLQGGGIYPVDLGLEAKRGV